MKDMKHLLMGLAAALFFSSCGSDDPFFAADSSRTEVYRIMGRPSNIDDTSIAVWRFHDPKQNGVKWRTIFNDGNDAYFAVFNSEGKALLPRLSFSASTIESTMTDKEIVKWAEELHHEGWGR